jgi:beta-lactam-binding protein with PASTA domain
VAADPANREPAPAAGGGSGQAAPGIALQCVASVACTVIAQDLGDSLLGKLLAGVLGACVGAFLTAPGRRHNRRIVAVALLLALLGALRNAGSALADMVRRGERPRERTRVPDGHGWLPMHPGWAAGAAVIGFAVGTGAAAAAGVLTTSAHRHHPSPPAGIVVPSVVGRDARDALSLLAARGFLAVTRPAVSASSTLRVTSQHPGAGRRAQRGATVVVVVASAPRAVIVPGVVGDTAGAAAAALTAVGLKPAETERASSSATPGTVISAIPAAGTTVDPGATVTIAVAATQIPTVAVPDVTGDTVPVAERMLADARLRSTEIQQPSSTATPGTVIVATPTVGTIVDAGTTVTIAVATAPIPTVTVPDVSGKSAPVADRMLADAGLKPTNIYVSYSNATPGTVISTGPAAGTAVGAGAAVTVSVAATPPVTG